MHNFTRSLLFSHLRAHQMNSKREEKSVYVQAAALLVGLYNLISVPSDEADALSSLCCDLDSVAYWFKTRWTIVNIDHIIIDCAHVETFIRRAQSASHWLSHWCVSPLTSSEILVIPRTSNKRQGHPPGHQDNRFCLLKVGAFTKEELFPPAPCVASVKPLWHHCVH